MATVCLDENVALDYVEARLDAAGRERVDAHVDECAACRKLVAALADLWADPNADTGAMSTGLAHLEVGASIGRYRVLERIGAGAMGLVLRAHDPELDREVALKMVRAFSADTRRTDPAAQARLVQEARAMARVAHPNVVTVFEAGTVDDHVYLAMELVRGGTLQGWLDAAPRSLNETVANFVLAGRGLAAAHDAGIVHRDFKPTNVLVAGDASGPGRVKVTDFGLAAARLSDAAARGAGTPAFMAPEQRIGGPVDARADQFAFCRSLQRCLGSHVQPRWLAVVVARGLSTDPADRYPNMDELLRDLGRDVASARRRKVAIAVGVVAVLGSGVGGIALGGRGPIACEDAGTGIEDVVAQARNGDLERAFEQTGRPEASIAAQGAAQAMEAYAVAWRAASLDNCQATRVRMEQSEAFFDRRSSCLSERKRALEATVSQLLAADGVVVDHALASVLALPAVADCATLHDGMGDPAPKDGELARALAEIETMERTGRYAQGLAAATQLTAEHPSAQARIALVEGTLLEQSGHPRKALERLRHAAYLGEANRLDYLAARAWTRLVYVAGERMAQWDRASQWAERAEAAVLRVGSPPRLEVPLQRNLGILQSYRGEFDLARLHLDRALALSEEGHPDRSAAWQALGVLEERSGRVEQALTAHQKAVDLHIEINGERHPDVALALSNLGNAQLAAGQLDDAKRSFTRARELVERVLGRGHTDYAGVLSNLASVERARGNFATAEGLSREALAIRESVLGPEHPHLIGVLTNLGNALQGQDELEEAAQHYERALALLRSVHGGDHLRMAALVNNVAELRRKTGAYEEAVAGFSRADEIWSRAGTAHPKRAYALTGIGLSHVEAGRPERGIGPLEHALKLRSGNASEDDKLAWTRFALARALWSEPASRERARSLADKALMAYEVNENEKDYDQVRKWLIAHSIRALAAVRESETERTGVTLDEARFVEFVESKTDPATPWTELKIEELYLACACLEGKPGAVDCFDRDVFPIVETALRKFASASEREEISQELRTQMLTGPRPTLLTYAGRGTLRAWVSAAAVRMALRRGKQASKVVELSDKVLVGAGSAREGLEIEHLKRHYRDAFKIAFQAALSELEPRARTLLRLQVLDGLGIDAMGSLYGVHRSTAARWLASAREQLLKRTRFLLSTALEIDRREFESIMGLIESKLDVSLSRVLKEEDASR